MTADATLHFDVTGRDRGGSDVLDRTGDAAERTGGKFDHAAEAAKHLSRGLADAKTRHAELRREFAETGDFSLVKDINAANREITKLSALSSTFDDSTKSASKLESAIGLVENATARVAPVARAMFNPYVAGAAAAAAALLLIPVGAAVAGAATAGLGLGIIGLGAMAVKGSHRVAAAATDLQTTWVSAVQRAGHATQTDFVRALNTLEGTAKRVEPSLTRVFANVTPSAVNLARGVDQLAKNAMPGLERAGIASAGVLNRLEPALGDLGSSVGEFGESLAGAAEGGGAALVDMIGLLGNSLETLGHTLEGASNAYQFLLKDPGWHKWLPPVAIGRAYNDWATGVDATTTAAEMSKQGFTSLAATTQASKAVVEAHERANFNLAASMKNVSNMALSLAGSEIAAVDARVRMNTELKDGAKSLDINTAAGRANKQSILDGVAAAIRYGEAETKRTGNTNAGAAAQQRHTDAMYKNAVAVLGNEDAVRKLWASLGLLPPSKSIPVSVPGAVPAKTALDRLRTAIADLPTHKQTTIVTHFVSRYSTVTGAPRRGQIPEAFGASGGQVGRLPVKGFADGGFSGFVRGPGTTTSDSIPMPWVSDQEYVIKARSTASIGVPALDYMNATGRIPPTAPVPRRASVATLGGGPGAPVVHKHYHVTVGSGVIGSRRELQNWFVQTMDELQTDGRVR